MEKLPDRDGSNESAFVYNGTARTPGVTVRDGNTVLIEGIDYVQTWKDNIHAGSASVIVKGKGNYTGTKSLPFTIQKAVLTEAQLSSPVLEYNGEEQTVTVSGGRAGSLDVPSDQWSVSGDTAREVGEYTLTVQAKEGGNFRGSAFADYRIVPDEAEYWFARKSGIWVRGSKANAVFTIKRTNLDHLTYERFMSLEVDGKTITTKSYEKEAGSVILSIYPSYLEKLKDGRHLLTAKFTDGEVHTEFTVLGSSSKEEEETESSQWIPPLLPGNGNRNQVVNTSDHTHIAGHGWTMILSLITALLAYWVLEEDRRK